MLQLVHQAAAEPEQKSACSFSDMGDALTIRGREFSALLALHYKFTEMGLFRDYGILGMSDGSNGSIGAIVFMENADETPLARISKQERGGEVVWVCETRERSDIYSRLKEVCVNKSQLVFLNDVSALFTYMHEDPKAADGLNNVFARVQAGQLLNNQANTREASEAPAANRGSPHLSVIK